MNIIDINKERQILASCLPDGQFWSNKNILGTKLGELINAFANTYNMYRYYANDQQKELIIFNVSKYLDLWENLFGLPDETFNDATTFEARVLQILIKFIGLNCYTRAEVLNLLQILYPKIRQIKITSGTRRASFPSIFPIPFFESMTQASGYCYIDIYGISAGTAFGDSLFPIPFGQGDATVIEKILNIIKPHNKQLIISYFD